TPPWTTAPHVHTQARRVNAPAVPRCEHHDGRVPFSVPRHDISKTPNLHPPASPRKTRAAARAPAAAREGAPLRTAHLVHVARQNRAREILGESPAPHRPGRLAGCPGTPLARATPSRPA